MVQHFVISETVYVTVLKYDSCQILEMLTLNNLRHRKKMK